MKFIRFIAVFIVVFLLASPASALTGNSGQPTHYLALGDSLAAGMIQDGSIGKGYSDFLAEKLAEEGLLASYNKGFAFPGYQTTHILQELSQNVEKPATETGELVALQDEIEKADVITLSIGANDVLAKISKDEEGKPVYNLLEISAAVSTVGQNINTILEEIAVINPEADVFVMGYYNPFPYATAYQAQFNQLVTLLDSTVRQVVGANKMYFVEVADTLAANTQEYLPNPENVHPGEAGYEAIANVFFEPVMEYINLIPLPGIIELPTFSDLPADYWATEYASLAAHYGIVKGYPDGTFRPNNKLTRVHVTSILARSLNLTETAKVPYTDIAKYSADTQQEIAAAYKAGILPSGTLLKPTQPVTRLEMAYMIDKAYTYLMDEKYMPNQVAPFTDIASYSAEDKRVMTLLYDLGMATGDKGEFKPVNTITRAHAVKMLSFFYIETTVD